MRIKIKLYASLRYQRFDATDWECDEGHDIATIVAELGLPKADVGIVLVNGIHAGWEESVREGDVLSLLPRMGGG